MAKGGREGHGDMTELCRTDHPAGRSQRQTDTDLSACRGIVGRTSVRVLLRPERRVGCQSVRSGATVVQREGFEGEGVAIISGRVGSERTAPRWLSYLPESYTEVMALSETRVPGRPPIDMGLNPSRVHRSCVYVVISHRGNPTT